MTTLNIGGKRVKVGDDFLKLSPEQQQATVDEIANQIGATAASPAPPAEPVQEPAAPTVRYGEDIARSAVSGLRSGVEGMVGMFGDAAQMQGDIAGWAAGKFGASPETQALFRKGGRMLHPTGFALSTPEIQAGTNAVVGEGYKPQTMPGEYARTIGQFAPNMVSPGTLARKTAATVIPALVSETAGQLTKGTAAEPYARGAGALAGGVATMGRNVKVPKPVAPAAPAAEEMASEANQLYTKMRESGVIIKPDKISHLKANIGLSLRETNPDLAPKAFGLSKLAGQTLASEPGIGELHNLAKSVNRALREVKPGSEDAHYVGLLKTQIENTIESMTAADIKGGGTEAFTMWKEADKLWARQKKTQIIENILDNADRKGTGQYTQSGVANAVRREMETLYKSIQKGRVKGFTPQEIALVRQMAKGGSNSKIVNLLAKFAPRGVVSAIGGFALGGPALTLAGHVAGNMADKGALTAANTLRDATASGIVNKFPALPKDPNALIRLLMNAKSGENSAKANTLVR